ncbi:MucR family transcriptional regulator [Methylobacterium sp. NEAU K]|uniref:MucR family transcriptional regulator n=1 Tax=Methylobacterium sp. NEAU K TaxID=3064946 RepID=UPI0027353A95|nr:MucR family transcriptional regulator [Methylobacterium sp. NEAU K]MDP4004808.1 MucR family transcriptional regulator [Methylobacterium sp. NEAU K]
MNENRIKLDLVAVTAEVVAAYVSNNSILADDLSPLLGSVYTALRQVTETRAVETPQPVIPVAESVTPDHIVCLEDGKTFKSLKRHLRARYNMSPEEYRAKWDLPADYPMVAPNYAKTRSDLAKATGLGRLDPYKAAA